MVGGEEVSFSRVDRVEILKRSNVRITNDELHFNFNFILYAKFTQSKPIVILKNTFP